MNNKYVNKLKRLINFGVSENENLTTEDRINRMQEFRKTLSVENYYGFINEIQEFLLDENIQPEEKDEVIFLTLRFINDYVPLRENINKFPKLIVELNNSNEEFNRVNFLLQELTHSDVTKTYLFEETIKLYFEFIDNPQNDFYIHNCYSRIAEFNRKILIYLETKDFEGVAHKENINNPELIAILNEKINILNNTR